jgi:hypothetical protein
MGRREHQPGKASLVPSPNRTTAVSASSRRARHLRRGATSMSPARRVSSARCASGPPSRSYISRLARSLIAARPPRSKRRWRSALISRRSRSPSRPSNPSSMASTRPSSSSSSNDAQRSLRVRSRDLTSRPGSGSSIALSTPIPAYYPAAGPATIAASERVRDTTSGTLYAGERARHRPRRVRNRAGRRASRDRPHRRPASCRPCANCRYCVRRR